MPTNHSEFQPDPEHLRRMQSRPKPDPGYGSWQEKQAIRKAWDDAMQAARPVPTGRFPAPDPDLPDPSDVQAIADLNAGIHETVESFAERWLAMEEEANRVLREWLTS